MTASRRNNERLEHLLATVAVEGLSDTEMLERVAAAITIASLRPEPMPASLRARVEADAEAWMAGRRPG